MFRFVVSNELSEDAVRIRTDVFVEEQGFIVEFDDMDAVSTHIVMYEDDEAVAVCRLIPDGDKYIIGRVAVDRSHRGRSLGSLMMAEAEKEIRSMGFGRAVLSAQVRAKGFYNSCGYTEYGDVYLDEGCPHTMMGKDL